MRASPLALAKSLYYAIHTKADPVLKYCFVKHGKKFFSPGSCLNNVDFKYSAMKT